MHMSTDYYIIIKHIRDASIEQTMIDQIEGIVDELIHDDMQSILDGILESSP